MACQLNGAGTPADPKEGERVSFSDDDMMTVASDLMAVLRERDALRAEVARLRADYERMWSALQAETATGVQVRGDLRAEIERLRAVIRKHYPSIAGHVMRLQEGHESRAAGEWEAVAHDFADAIGIG